MEVDLDKRLIKSVIKKLGFEIVAELGEGSYGVVYKIYHGRKKLQQAVKITLSQICRNELAFWPNLHHKNIHPLIEHFTVGSHAFFFTDVYATSLYKYVQQQPLCSTSKIRDWCKDLLEAVLYLHQLHIVHLDIQPANVLLDRNLVAILTDFGLATKVTGRPSALGCPLSRPPEAFELTAAIDLKKVDVWMVGSCIYYCVTKKKIMTFGIRDHWEAVTRAIHKIRKMEKIEEVDQELKDFIQFMLRVNPFKRPTVQQALQHSFLHRTTSDPGIKVSKSWTRRMQTTSQKPDYIPAMIEEEPADAAELSAKSIQNQNRKELEEEEDIPNLDETVTYRTEESFQHRRTSLMPTPTTSDPYVDPYVDEIPLQPRPMGDYEAKGQKRSKWKCCLFCLP